MAFIRLPILAAALTTGTLTGLDALAASERREISLIPMTRSPCGRIEVRGPNSIVRLTASQWVRETLDAIAQTIGIPAPFSRTRRLRVDLIATPDGSAPAVRVIPAGIALRDLQRLVIRDHENVPELEAGVALCRVALNAIVVSRSPPEAAPRDVPAWMYEGLARLIDPARRGDSSDTLLSAWRQGLFPSPIPLFDAEAPLGEIRAAAACVMVGWLTDNRNEQNGLALLLDRLAHGKPVTVADVSTVLTGDPDPVVFVEAWDWRLLREQRMVYRPGAISASTLTRFRLALLLYPGRGGIPFSADLVPASSLADAIDHRHEPWIADFAAAKRRELRVLATGQGEELNRVAELFCAFLDGLAAGKSESDLRERLALAREALQRIVENIGKKRDGGNE